jgi:hypothetical protein
VGRWIGPGASLAGLVALGAMQAGELPYGLRLARDERVRIAVRVVAPDAAGRPPIGGAFDLDPAGVGALTLEAPWPAPGAVARLTLRAERLPAPAGTAHRLVLEADVGAGGTPAGRARRELAFDEETTVLFEIARSGDRPLTLAVTAEASTEQVLTAEPPAGAPVRLGLDIQWVEQGQAVSLETNQLNTLVGEAVSYAFHLGGPGAERAAQLRLLPAMLLGGVLQMEVEINATMPGPEGRVLATSRRERWISSDGATSTLSLESGEPARGFRFLVTPHF